MITPRYQVLAEELMAQISRGDVALGARLPTEHALCSQYELSRSTVREALRCVEELGMIERLPGAGTRVIASHPTDGYQPMPSGADEVMELFKKTKLRQPTIESVKVDKDLSERLGIEIGAVWFVLSGARVLRKRPTTTVCWSQHYLPTRETSERLRRGDFTLADVESFTVEQVVTAELLTKPIATRLEAKAGSPALVVRRWHHDKKGNVVDVGVHTHPADRFRIRTTFNGRTRKR
jgi:GntR family transcriptional regulator